MSHEPLRRDDGEIDARSSRSGGGGGPVTKEQCAAMRLAFDLHVRKKTIATIAGVSPTAVSIHVRGNCSHDHESDDA